MLLHSLQSTLRRTVIANIIVVTTNVFVTDVTSKVIVAAIVLATHVIIFVAEYPEVVTTDVFDTDVACNVIVAAIALTTHVITFPAEYPEEDSQTLLPCLSLTTHVITSLQSTPRRTPKPSFPASL